jgi:hypothetical protein
VVSEPSLLARFVCHCKKESLSMAAAVPGAEGGCGGGGSVVRIFVGGLAEGVREGDLESVFGSIGRVAGVEFVRTNGRSFAYVDFHCPSDKALAKLFSTVRSSQSSTLYTDLLLLRYVSSACSSESTGGGD